ncbi:hypothetical protein [Roseinatronobacter sp. S2]|uniref:hypothetical protein n=1 Tax=Roseinatronobacter sp. S2 TaxID=3035471 RepID=UPI00240F624D|nr:hypothetical protein [Roseinatronobacter sp. S2]WFE73338.1 hypothetical protein P8S53_09060 [Roseinatronobacter sp. S2]
MNDKFHPILVAEAKKRLLELISERGGHLSFAELNRLEPNSLGDLWFSLFDHPNILMWDRLSQPYAQAISELLQSSLVHAHPATELTYMLDGFVPKFPIAKSIETYREPHWFPMTLHNEPLEA